MLAPVLHVTDRHPVLIEHYPNVAMVDPYASVANPDNSTLAGAGLTVTIENGTVDDTLVVLDRGSASPYLRSGDDVYLDHVLIGTISKGQGTEPLRMTFGETFTLSDLNALIKDITLQHTGDVKTETRILRYELVGFPEASEPSHATVGLLHINELPTLVNLPGVEYTETKPPVAIAAQARVTEPDNANFAGGVLKVAIRRNGEDSDVLSLVPADANLTIASGELLWLGNTVGTISGGQDGTPLVASFNANATANIVQTIVRSISFQPIAQNPSRAERAISIELIDGHGDPTTGLTSVVRTVTVDIKPLNQAPGLSGLAPITYTESMPVVLIAPQAIVADPDNASLERGSLTVSILDGVVSDQLDIAAPPWTAGQLNYRFGELWFDDQQLATVYGGTNNQPLRIMFLPELSLELLQTVVRSLSFRAWGSTPNGAGRTIGLAFQNIDGEVSTSEVPATITWSNTAPQFGTTKHAIDYVEGTGPVFVAADDLILDPDSANFDRGKLRIDVTSAADPSDTLTIGGVGGVTVSAGDVLVDGTAIGRLRDTSTAISLTIDLNANASALTVQALVRSTRFETVDSSTGLGDRIIALSLSDGDGGTSLLRKVSIVTQPVGAPDNAPPQLASVTTSAQFYEKDPGTWILPTVVVNDDDSPNYTHGTLTFALQNNAEAADRIFIADYGPVTSSGNQLIVNAKTVGTFAGGVGTEPLVVMLNDRADDFVAGAIMRAARFASVSLNPAPASRRLAWRLTTGDGHTTEGLVTISVNRNVDRPFLDGLHPVRFESVEGMFDLNQGVRSIFEDVTLFDPDHPNYAGGNIYMDAPDAGARAGLLLFKQGPSGFEIKFDESLPSRYALYYKQQPIGLIWGGHGGGDLRVQLNENESVSGAVVEEFLHCVTLRVWNREYSEAEATFDVRVLIDSPYSSLEDKVAVTVDKIRGTPGLMVNGVQNLTFSTKFSENAQPIVPATWALVVNNESDSFAGGRLQVALVTGSHPDSFLSIRNQGNGAGQIGVDGNVVTLSGVPIGTFRGGSANWPLVVSFNYRADVDAVKALIRNVTFVHVGDNPPPSQLISYFITDREDGAATEPNFCTVNITAINDPSKLEVEGEGSYTEGGNDLPLAPQGDVSDPDSVNFSGGSLTVAFGSGAQSGDGIGIAPDSAAIPLPPDAKEAQPVAPLELRISAARDVATSSQAAPLPLYVDGVLVGSYRGGTATTPLQIFFNSSATQPRVQKLLHRILFGSDSEIGGTRTLNFTLKDGDGGTSNVAQVVARVTAVNDAPILKNSLAPALPTIQEDELSPAGTTVASLLSGAVTDPDIGARQGIAVTAASTLYGAWQYSLDAGKSWQAMGAVSESAARLVPGWARARFVPKTDFNGTVKLYYRAWDQTQGKVGGTYNLTGRTGGTTAFSAAFENASLTVAPVNDPPKLTLGGTLGYVHDSAPVTLAAGALVSDLDSANFYQGRLRVWITDGTSASNRLSIGAGFTVDANNNVLQNGVIIGKRVSSGLGTSELLITFSDKATPAIVQNLVRAIAFKTVGGSAGTRKILFTVSDGDGGLSAEATKTVNVS